MDPNLWGYMYWFMLHCAGMYWKNKGTLTNEQAVIMKRFLEIMCRLLICPPCSMHCQLHVTKNPPVFTTGHDFWKYLVDFHNTVNQRKLHPSITLSYEEADAKLLEQLKGFDPVDVCNDQIWACLLLTSARYFPAEKTEATEDEQTMYRQFITDWFRVMPFGSKVIAGAFAGEDKTVRDVAIEALQTMDLRTREASFTSICSLYNVAAPHFGLMPRSTDETRVVFNNFWGTSSHSMDIQRSTKRHDEDQQKLIQMQKELHNMQQLMDRTDTQQLQSYKTATIVLTCILGLIIIGLIVLAIVWRRQGWKLVRRQSKEIIKTEAV